jgi:hypothetical protein
MVFEPVSKSPLILIKELLKVPVDPLVKAVNELTLP